MYKISTYKNGKLLGAKEYESGSTGTVELYLVIQKRIKSHIKDLTPYLNGFSKLVTELENTDFQLKLNSTLTTSNTTKTTESQLSLSSDFNLSNYEGVLTVEDLDEYNNGVINSISISDVNGNVGTVDISYITNVGGGWSKGVYVNSTFEVNESGVATFRSEDAEVYHDVKMTFLKDGIIVDVVNGSKVDNPGNSWSLWNGEIKFLLTNK